LLVEDVGDCRSLLSAGLELAHKLKSLNRHSAPLIRKEQAPAGRYPHCVSFSFQEVSMVTKLSLANHILPIPLMRQPNSPPDEEHASYVERFNLHGRTQYIEPGGRRPAQRQSVRTTGLGRQRLCQDRNNLSAHYILFLLVNQNKERNPKVPSGFWPEQY